MTTNTTNSQAASIDTYEFRQLAANYGMAWTGTKESEQRRLKALVAHIDAKLAQMQDDGDLRYKELAELHERTLDKLQLAESRLAEIQRGVEAIDNPFSGYHLFNLHAEAFDRCRKQVLALLQPQGQADTNGLRG